MPVVHLSAAGRRDFLKAAGAAAAVAAFPAVARAQAREVKVGYILPVTGPLAVAGFTGLMLARIRVEERALGGLR